MFSPAGFLAILALFGHASGHMLLAQPVPYGEQTLDNSPLKSDGSDYPCKQRTGVYDLPSSGFNEMIVGEDQPLEFKGSASHGGGTCQLSVTTDLEPTKDSVFKIIKVFEGGCPTAADGNSGSSAFTYQIPPEVPSGNFTLSWMWYNKIGNREVYQNCAPISVSGGAQDKTDYDTLPNHYLVNLPPSECSSVESTDLEIPNPGNNVVKQQANSIAAATGPGCAAAAAAQTKGVSGGASSDASATASSYGSASAPTAAPSSYASSSASTASSPPSYGSAPAPSASGPSSYGTSSSPSAPSTMATSIVSTTVPTAYPTLEVTGNAGIHAPAGTGSAPAPVGTGSAPSKGTCSDNGALVCNGSDQFGLCDNGKIVWQKVADGTTCSNGQIVKRDWIGRFAHIRRHMQHIGRAGH